MWQFIKDYHFYQPEEKRAIIVLLALIMLTIGVTIVYERKYRPITSPDDELALQAFADSIQRRDSLASHRSRHNNYQRNYELYTRRNQSQRFTTSRRQSERPIRVAKDTVSSLLIDTLPRYERVEKYEPGTLVNLNKADTTELKKIPGIGSGIARMIVNYRNRLGGFYKVEQLREINLDASQLLSWFSIDEAEIQKIPVNKSSVDRLRNHPYINFYQAKAIVEHRRKHGNLQSLKPLVLYEEFKETDLERIAHYLSFE